MIAAADPQTGRPAIRIPEFGQVPGRLQFHCHNARSITASMKIPSAKRLAYLDSLRFAAAALVLIQHLFETMPGSALMPFVRLGPGVAGVAIFFLISGFIIPFSTGRSFAWRSFLVRRLFRIYPLYLAALLVILIAGQLAILPRWQDMGAASAIRWIANLALLQDFVGVPAFLGVSWTLGIELVWYVLFAVSLVIWQDDAAKWLDRLVPGALLALTLLSLVLHSRIPLGRPMMIYAAVLGFQCQRHAVGRLDDKALLFSILRFALVSLTASWVAFGYFHHPRITLAQDLGPWVLALAVFLACVLSRSLREAKWLNAGPAPYLGAISYSIYLLHPVVINATDLYVGPQWRVAVALGGTCLLAALAHRFVEVPGIALGRWVVGRFVDRAGPSLPRPDVGPVA